MLAEVEQEIAKLQRVADALRGSESPQERPTNNHGAGRTVSASARRRMSLAQRARWAKARKEPQQHMGLAKTTSSAPIKRTMSAAARKKIAAFQRARWAKIRGKKAA
jgi:hypothetical protein